MKIIFIILYIFLFVSPISSQSFEKEFADTTLCYMNTSIIIITGPQQSETINLRSFIIIYSDTIVNDTLFQKAYRAQPSQQTLLGYFKKENNQVYFTTDFNSYKLLYNYDLMPGDTFSFECSYDGFNDTVFSVPVVFVDSIYINGRMRKRIEFAAYSGVLTVVWVEGLGDYNYGIIFDYGRILDYSWGNSYIECFVENDVNLIGNCQLQLSTNINQVANKEYISLYPNPFNELIHIGSNCHNKIIRIKIYTTQGILLESTNLNNSQTLNLSHLKNGVYIFEIQTQNKKMTRKMLKYDY